MATGIRSAKDFWLGIVYAVVGAGGYWMARDYPYGSGASMGAGYFPTIVSCLLFGFGIVSIGRSVVFQHEPVGRIAWVPLALIVGSSLSFALLVSGTGFALAALFLLFMAAIASDRFRWSWAATLGACAIIAVCALVFIRVLGIPLPIVGPWVTTIGHVRADR